MWQVIDGIQHAQALQDSEGHEHPDQTQVFTFEAPWWLRWYLRCCCIRGLTFERYAGTYWGIFRARK